MSTRSRILQACFVFLVPLARLLLRSGVSYREFAEISRLAFVEVAGRDFGIRGRLTNMSRVSAMTGIGRKEVRRLRDLEKDFDRDLQDHLRTHFNPLGDVLHYWFTDENYLDAKGTPRALAMRGAGSFEELVKRCAGDLPAGAIKVELMRCGAVAEDAKGYLHVKRRVLIPVDVDEKVVTYLATRLRGHVLTAVHNCMPMDGDSTWLEREVYSTRVPRAGLAELRRAIKEQVAECAGEVDDLVSKAEAVGGDSIGRVGVGFFYYEDPD